MHTLTTSPKLFKLTFSKEIFDVTYSHQMKAGGAALSFATRGREAWHVSNFVVIRSSPTFWQTAHSEMQQRKSRSGIVLEFFTLRSMLKCDGKISGVYFERASRDPKHVPAAFSNLTAIIQRKRTTIPRGAGFPPVYTYFQYKKHFQTVIKP